MERASRREIALGRVRAWIRESLQRCNKERRDLAEEEIRRSRKEKGQRPGANQKMVLGGVPRA
jgi:hypothetical protein